VLKREEFDSDKTKAIYKQILGGGSGALLLQAANIGKGYGLDDGSFISLIDQCLDLGLTECVSRILEENRRKFQATQFPENAEARVAQFLGGFAKSLQRRQGVIEAPATSALKAFFATTIRKGLLHTAPVYPEDRFKVSRLIRFPPFS